MIKCKSCGEISPENSNFCSFCGKSFAGNDSVSMKEALKNAQKSFERDSLASLDRSRITYICTVCGTVNGIDRDRCSKCGKPRPRNEFVSALKRIKEGIDYRDECKTSDSETRAGEDAFDCRDEEQENIAVQQPKQFLRPHQTSDGQYVSGGGQANSIVQPFIVVPYVNQNQPIWQNRPEQLFKFEPYTQEEIQRMEAQRADAARALAERAELDRYIPSADAKVAPSLKGDKKARTLSRKDKKLLRDVYSAKRGRFSKEAPSMVGEKETTKRDPASKREVGSSDSALSLEYKTRPVRAVAAILMLFSCAVIVLSFILGIFQIELSSSAKPTIFFIVGIGDCIQEFIPGIPFTSQGYGYTSPTDFIAPIAFIMFILMSTLLIVRSFARLLKGFSPRKGCFLPLMMVLFFLTGIVGLIEKYASFSSEGLEAFLENVGIGMYVIVGISVVSLIASLFSPVNIEKRRRKNIPEVEE